MSKERKFIFRAEIAQICEEYNDRELKGAIFEAIIMLAIYGLDTKFAEPKFIECFNRCKKYVKLNCAK